MGLGINISVDSSSLSSKLQSIKQAVTEFVRTEPKKIADDMVTQMQQIAPVDTGYLRDHITAEENGDNSATVTSEADYSIYVEFGTRYMSAEPFFFVVVDKFSSQSIASDFGTAVHL